MHSLAALFGLIAHFLEEGQIASLNIEERPPFFLKSFLNDKINLIEFFTWLNSNSKGPSRHIPVLISTSVNELLLWCA